MRSRRLGFGLFILTIGLGWLASVLGWQPTGWSTILPYWPVVLILWGVAIMVRQPVARGLALALAAIFAGLWFVSWFDPGTQVATTDNQSLAVAADSSVKTGTLQFDSGAGSFTVGSVSDGSDLVTTSALSPWGTYQLDKTVTDGQLNARVWYDQPWRRPMAGMMSGWRNEATINLSPDLVWHLNVNVGAADLTIQAEDLKLARATISAGASDLNIKLGDDLSASDVVVKAGASDISVMVPTGAGVRAELSTGLTGHDLADLIKQSETTWQSADYDASSHKIDLHFEAGVSDIQLIRY